MLCFDFVSIYDEYCLIFEDFQTFRPFLSLFPIYFLILQMHRGESCCVLTSWVEKDMVSDSEVIRKLESPYQ